MIDNDFTKEANICTILTFIIPIISYIIKKDILISLCIFICTFLLLVIYFILKKHRNFIVIENKRIDILPLIDPIKKEDYTLIPKHIEHKHIVDGEQVKFIYIYSGVCISKKGEENIIFNIGAEEYIPFDELECYAFDLQHDEYMKTKIIPSLVGNDGLSKKIKIDFLHKLEYGDCFKIMFIFVFPHCLKFGKDYISVCMSYYKKTINEVVNEIIFKDIAPLYVKVYNICNSKVEYIATIEQVNIGNNEYKYTHVVNGCKGDTSLIYFINRKK